MIRFFCMLYLCVFLLGCAHFGNSNNEGALQSYPAPLIEPTWIRNGEPIVFEGKKWFPVSDVESLMDSEMFQVGEYKGIQIFVDKVDIKPYARLYTKFAKNKFRYFERHQND